MKSSYSRKGATTRLAGEDFGLAERSESLGAWNRAQPEKPESYYSHPRLELIPLVPPAASRILEIGCGDGAFASALRSARHPKALEIVGVEFHRAAAAAATNKLDAVFVGNIETVELNYANYFDCAIFADVLEHLVNPWTTLVKIKKYLRPDGFVIASVPNVQHWRVSLNLLRGCWDYANEGILDSTHLRFFTRKSLAGLFADTGYNVRVLLPNILTARGRAMNRITLRRVESFIAFQYFVLADCVPPKTGHVGS